MGLWSELGSGRKLESISMIKGIGENFKGLEICGWKVGLLATTSRWDHKKNKYMVKF